MMNPPAKPRPNLLDPVTGPFWTATREGRLEIPRCTNCGYLEWPPEAMCPECQHIDREWVEVAPVGHLWSYATYHRALDPAFANDVPYSVGLVALDAGPKMYGLMLDDETDLEIGRRVRAAFEPVDSEVTFVRWKLDDQA